uniref:Coiled-coil domain-containing protein n=1 Tax=Sipha flava TaxID=143950 RepID=A0A2S2Q421_9HEMI
MIKKLFKNYSDVNIDKVLNRDSNRSINTMESVTYQSCSENSSVDVESMNSNMTSIIPPSINNEIINNQLIVLEPNNPVMVRFQNTLKQHLLKQRDNIQEEVLKIEKEIKSKQNEKLSFIKEINNTTSRIETQHGLLSKFHEMKKDFEKTKKEVETSVSQGKQRHNDIITKTTLHTKKILALKRQLDCSRGLLKELTKYEKEQEITFNICNQKKSQAKHYKKKLLNDQQKQDLLLLSLTQEILRLEDRMKQLSEQAETKYNERELLKQKVMDSSTDLDAINGDNIKITLLWNEVLISIQQRDKCFQKIKIDLQESKNKYHALLMEANSFKHSVLEELHKNNDLLSFLNKYKQGNNNLQNNFKINLDKFNCLKDEYSKIIQITEFQNFNLNQVILDQKSIENEMNTSLHFLDKKSSLKLKYEEDVLNELKKQLFANNNCVQINNRISKLKIQNKEHELILVGFENNLSQSLLKLEQYRTTSSNLENDIEKNTTFLNDLGFALSTLDSELKKLYIDIQNKSKQIDLENKQMETIKKKQDARKIINLISILLHFILIIFFEF